MPKKINIIITFAVMAMLAALAMVGGWYYGKDIPTDGWVIKDYPDLSGNQGSFMTMYNQEDGTLIVIDSGWKENEPLVRKVIASYGNHVTAWFLTHYHNDHVDALNEILENPGDIQIDAIYDSPINYEFYAAVAYEWDCIESYDKYLELTKGDERVHHLYQNDEFDIDGLHFKVFNSFREEIEPWGDVPNNASLVFKITGEEDSILIMGDAYRQPLPDYLIETYGEELKVDYVQAAHHGNNSAPGYFYDYTGAKEVWFEAPKSLMESDEHTAKELKEYLEGNGVVVKSYMTAPNVIYFK